MSADTRRPTMKDVAALAGVSLSTVSRVVNGDPGRPDLARRIQDAIDLLGYERDHTASTLRRTDRASASIGLLVADVGNPFFAAVARGVEEIARERGSVTMVASSDEDPARERELATALAARRVDGLVVVPTDGSPGPARVPTVFVDRPPRYADADTVLTDNFGGAVAAVTHLRAHGHRRIGFLGDRSTLHTAAERLRGYLGSLPDPSPARTDLSSGRLDPSLVRTDLEGSAAAFDAACALLRGDDPPTALFTAQNLITTGAVRALRALGLQHRVALVGFDDLPLADALDPGLTVVAQQPVTLGRAAARLLFSRIDGDRAEPRTEVVPTTLVVRGSGEIAR
ncbi:LacI family transcriptional regulator [Virgisporangium aliadipatigenens]|uniref:LacI family transcriptional regulator n=1 Tax=Virgisporangium aliadipatigenens TaxID=741659 RepID=A0A8J3YXC5_9ACTN|nr:LacI family DNA-binding transcriptional regulator [Virgisporangium aliadipatigenens]GIJ51525.1 LacI family transcriptional regulator [Virgisporangium aliadipatigenens]